MKNKTLATIQAFAGLRVLVIGESTTDIELKGNATAVAREAPVPIVQIKEIERVPGRASNAAINLAHLGAESNFISVVGNDDEAERLLATLKDQQVVTDHVLISPTEPTLTVQRVMAGDHMLVRFDCGAPNKLSKRLEIRLIRKLRKLFSYCDAIMVSDYGFGVLSDTVITEIKELQRVHSKILVVDSKRLDKYQNIGATAVKPNYLEALALLGITKAATPGKRAAQLQVHSEKILRITGAQYVAVTLDIEGAIIFQKGKEAYRTYGHPVEHSKAVGAGDTYSSALMLALAAGASIQEAAEIAQTAATIVVKKSGTASCHKNELMQCFSTDPKYIGDWQELATTVKRLRNEGRRVVFTNGCFDILHSGHVSYLNQARAQGDVLIVGLNTDKSVRKLRGPGRPLSTLEERVRVMSGLQAVDIITSFKEDLPFKIIEVVQPDIFVKGGDYSYQTLPEAPLVEQLGGQVAIMPFVSGRSTNGLIGRIHAFAKKVKVKQSDVAAQSLGPVN